MLLRNLTTAFTAGAVGGLANAALIWFMGTLGLTALMGVALTPAWTPAYLYPKIVWGGIWGFMFILPVLDRSVWRRGLLFSLAPTAMVLTVVLPAKGHEMLGTDLGTMLPVFALIVNGAWGVVTAWWYNLTR